MTAEDAEYLAQNIKDVAPRPLVSQTPVYIYIITSIYISYAYITMIVAISN